MSVSNHKANAIVRVESSAVHLDSSDGTGYNIRDITLSRMGAAQ